jgi:preprotein translocase subunit SecE
MATSRADVPSSTADNLKTAVAVAVVIIALVAFYMFADQSLLMRVLALLVAGGVAVALYYQTERGRRTVGFFRDARTEVRKVVWPSRQETMQTTLTVFVIVVIIGIFLWLLDMVLSGLFKMITGIG